MKIVIAGGSGFIGTYLSGVFAKRNDEVIIVARKGGDVSWDLSELKTALSGADLLINLAGKTINCRHTAKNKALILNSRIETTLLLGEAVKNCSNPPRLWINASATAIYADQKGTASTESRYKESESFLAQVVKKWEKTFFETETSSTRKVALRTSVVLGRNGGAFKPLLLLAKMGLGGKVGKGTQMFSWIHQRDYFRIIEFIMMNDQIGGIINCTSPNPLSNKDLMQSIRKNVGVWFGLPAPSFAVKIGTFLIGTESDLVLDSVNTLPEVLTMSGYKFEYPDIHSALKELTEK